MWTRFRSAKKSKEVFHGKISPPPRPTLASPKPATVVALEQLWTRIPLARQQELLRQLTRMLAQRLAPPDSKEEADE